MLTKLQRNFLEYCCNNGKTSTFNTLRFSKEFYKSFPVTEIRTVCESLATDGYMEIISKNIAGDINFRLTHKGMHYEELSHLAFIEYIKDKWVDIAALIFSILAFIGAYRNEISAVIQKLMK